MKISIVIPAHNEEGNLEALDAVPQINYRTLMYLKTHDGKLT